MLLTQEYLLWQQRKLEQRQRHNNNDRRLKPFFMVRLPINILHGKITVYQVQLEMNLLPLT